MTTNKVAGAPFDIKCAEAILHSTDVRKEDSADKVSLALASPVFMSMFGNDDTICMAPATESTTDKPQPEHIPSRLNSVILDHLLCYCSPVPDPIGLELATLGQVLEAAVACRMDGAISTLGQHISTYKTLRALQNIHDTLALEVARGG